MRYLKPLTDALGYMRSPGDQVPDDLPERVEQHYLKKGYIGELEDDHPDVVAAEKRLARLTGDDNDTDADPAAPEGATAKELDAIADKARAKFKRQELNLKKATDPAKKKELESKIAELTADYDKKRAAAERAEAAEKAEAEAEEAAKAEAREAAGNEPT